MACCRDRRGGIDREARGVGRGRRSACVAADHSRRGCRHDDAGAAVPADDRNGGRNLVANISAGVSAMRGEQAPGGGEFRIQEEFGGLYSPVPAPAAGAVALAEEVLAAVGEPLLHARIDMVPDADGRWLLMEAELIEPDFYLGVDPARAGRVCAGVAGSSGDWRGLKAGWWCAEAGLVWPSGSGIRRGAHGYQ